MFLAARFGGARLFPSPLAYTARGISFFPKVTCARFSRGYDTIIAVIRIAASQTGRACVGPCRSDGPEPSGREVRCSKGDRQLPNAYRVPPQGYLYPWQSRPH